MNKVLVTGAKGMLGQDLCPILEDEGFDVIETTIDDFDITDREKTQNFIKKQKPEIIIHTAAYTNVDAAENDKETAEKINVKGTENIAQIAKKLNATLVYISTDYVFDGTKESAYEPTDKPNPLNVYGKTKYEGELVIQKNCEKYYIIRTSWLYGIHGKNFVETMISLAKNKELKVVNDQIGTPTWSVDLSNAIIKLLKNKEEFGIYHICGSGKTSWYEFAKEIFEQSELKVNLKPCSTEEFPRPAKRPHFSVLNNNKKCESWKVALKKYLELRI